MKKYRAAVIGCGRIGALMEKDPKRVRPSTHAGAFQMSPDTELAALVDITPAQLKEALALFPGPQGFSDPAEMLKQMKPDIVSIATPPGTHRAMVELCAAANVPAIICEKPIAETVEDGQKIIDACRKSRSLLLINHMRRFDPLMRQTRDQLHQQTIGKIGCGSTYYTAGIFNTGTHLVDLLRYLLGEAVSVRAFTEKRMSMPPGDVSVNGWILFEGDIPVSMHCLEVKNYSIFDTRLYGQKGSLTIDRFGFTVETTPVRECIDYTGYKEMDVEHRRREGTSRSLLAPMAAHVVACLNGTDQPVSRGEDGLEALKILLALKESAAQDGKLVPLKREVR